jgi:hypothetical protein
VPRDPLADVGTAASVRAADVLPLSVVGAPASAVTLLSEALPPVAGVLVVVPPGLVPAGLVPADGAPDDDPVPPLVAGRLDGVVELRCVLVLVDGFAVGFGLDAAGGRMLGALPAPKAHPSTLPALGRYEPAPAVL